MDQESPKPTEATQPQPDTQNSTEPPISASRTPSRSPLLALAALGTGILGVLGIHHFVKPSLDRSIPQEVTLKTVPTVGPTPDLTATATEKARMDAINIKNAPPGTPIPLSTDKVQGR